MNTFKLMSKTRTTESEALSIGTVKISAGRRQSHSPSFYLENARLMTEKP